MRAALLFALIGIFLGMMAAVEMTAKPDIHNAPGSLLPPGTYSIRNDKQ